MLRACHAESGTQVGFPCTELDVVQPLRLPINLPTNYLHGTVLAKLISLKVGNWLRFHVEGQATALVRMESSVGAT